jgi:hypothetical protein
MDGFTWTRHAEHGGYFRCPDEALDDMAGRGWVMCDPPEPLNLATVEHPAQQAELSKTTIAASRGQSKEE